MWRRAGIAILIFVISVLAQAPKQSPAELERLDDVVRQLTELKAKVAAMDAQLEVLLRALSEQRGALQQKPQVYNALQHVESTVASAPDTAAPKSRCAALTANGTRCTRPAKPGNRYCSQHLLAHAK
jgi:hypothetical protein